MHLHVKGRFSVKLLADLILFTQPSAVCETAAKWIDSRARLQFRFFLNVFNCLLTTNLSRRNNRSRTGPQTLFNFRRNCNRQWIFIKFHVYSRYLAATRDVHSTTTGCKWLIFHFTTMMQRNQSAHTACMPRVRVICGGSEKTKNTKLIINKKYWNKNIKIENIIKIKKIYKKEI